MNNWTLRSYTTFPFWAGLTFGCTPISDSVVDTGFITSCFLAGTRVLTESGPRPIESLQANDRIWAWNTETDAPVLRKVLELIKGESTETFAIEAGEQHLQGVTAEHPFWNPATRTWIHAKDLTSDTTLLCWLGVHEAKPIAIQSAPAPKLHKHPVPVFTLSVEGPEHNFFANGILVHNKSPMIECFRVAPKEGNLVDFGSQKTEKNHAKEVILSIQQIEFCDWLEPEERQLQLTFDDPEHVFSGPTEPLILDLETTERPLMLYFTPAAEKDYEAQLELGHIDQQVANTIRLQLFGKGTESDE